MKRWGSRTCACNPLLYWLFMVFWLLEWFAHQNWLWIWWWKKWQAYKLVSCIVKINVSVYGAEEEWEVQVKSRNKTHFLLHHACSCSWVTWTYYFYSYNKVLNHRVHLASCLSFCVSRLVQKLGSEPLSLLKPTLVWWCITIGMLFSRSQSHWGNWYD